MRRGMLLFHSASFATSAQSLSDSSRINKVRIATDANQEAGRF